MRKVSSTAVALLAAASAALLVTGCEEPVPSEEGGGGSASPSPSASPSTSADPAPEAEADADLGKILPLGTTTKLTYKRGDRTGVLEITADKVVKGSQSDLGEVRLDAEERDMQPYYVTMTYENVGEKKVSHPYTPTGLRDSRGENAKVLITSEDAVKSCPNKGDYELAVGGSQTRCRVFLLDKDQQPATVMYTGDFDKEPVFWKSETKG